MADMFDDVDAAVQREKMLVWWQKNGNAVIGLALAILVGVGVNHWWQNRQRDILQSQTAELLNVLLPTQGETVAPDAARATLQNLQANGAKQLDVISGLQLAARYEADGKNGDAVNVLQPLLTRRYTDSLLHDLTIVQYVRVRLAMLDGKNDPADRDAEVQLLTLLEPATAAGRPFRFTAQELKALIYLREAKLSQHSGNTYNKDAAHIFKALSEDQAAPASLRQRAQAYLVASEAGR